MFDLAEPWSFLSPFSTSAVVVNVGRFLPAFVAIIIFKNVNRKLFGADIKIRKLSFKSFNDNRQGIGFAFYSADSNIKGLF